MAENAGALLEKLAEQLAALATSVQLNHRGRVMEARATLNELRGLYAAPPVERGGPRCTCPPPTFDAEPHEPFCPLAVATEPVAWTSAIGLSVLRDEGRTVVWAREDDFHEGTALPLYAAPPVEREGSAEVAPGLDARIEAIVDELMPADGYLLPLALQEESRTRLRTIIGKHLRAPGIGGETQRIDVEMAKLADSWEARAATCDCDSCKLRRVHAKQIRERLAPGSGSATSETREETNG